MTELIKDTPLKQAHIDLGAKLIDFAGWMMPVQYTTILKEHESVRTAVGVFDISHMGQLIVSGEQAESWLNQMLTNDVSKLAIGQGQYTLMLNEKGGVIDDLIVYREDEKRYFLVVNASMIDEDVAWLEAHLSDHVCLENQSDDWAGMAVQGPKAADLFHRLFPHEVLPERNGIGLLSSGEIVCRTGYTGEDGFEFFTPVAAGIAAWMKWVEAGAQPCGLGARDTLRLEMCYPLNGNDLSPERTPLEAGLGFFVAMEKNDFMGRKILQQQKDHGLSHKLVPLRYLEKGAPPRAHYPIESLEGENLGELSSGVLSPSLMDGIAMAYLPIAFTQLGSKVNINVRGRLFPAEVVKKPFYKKG